MGIFACLRAGYGVFDLCAPRKGSTQLIRPGAAIPTQDVGGERTSLFQSRC